MSTTASTQTELVLWTCITLFFARVIAQVEVLLLAPAWLPDMSAWYSGLLPYPILLPLQIALLMLMCALAIRQRLKRASAPAASGSRMRFWRALAIFYFAVMAVRLVVCVHQYGRDFYLHGGIPIAFHWVLALFALRCIITTPSRPSASASSQRLQSEHHRQD